MEALVFGDYSEDLNVVAHDNVALFEQYEPLAALPVVPTAVPTVMMSAMNDDVAASYASDDCAVDNLYMVPTW